MYTPEKGRIYTHQKRIEKTQPENVQHGKCMTWKMRTWKMHNMENERIRIAHMEKGRIFSPWKMIEKA